MYNYLFKAYPSNNYTHLQNLSCSYIIEAIELNHIGEVMFFSKHDKESDKGPHVMKEHFQDM